MRTHTKGTRLTPAERSLRARIGAYAQHAAHDPKLTTVAARAARMRRFEEKVDPEGILPPEERTRRAQSAFKAHMSRLALKSARIRRRRKEAALDLSSSACLEGGRQA